MYANHGFPTLCRLFFALRAKNNRQKKQSTMLPFALSEVEGQARIPFAYILNKQEHIMSLSINSAPDGVTIVRLSGRLDLLTAAQLKQDLSKIVGDGQSRLVIDLDAVTFIDSSGLGALIGGLKAARQAGGDLRIARAGQQARVILQLTTLDRVLKPYATIEEALSGY